MDKKVKPAEKDYRGADVDKADNDKTDARLVKEDVRDLNNNPRDNDLDE